MKKDHDGIDPANVSPNGTSVSLLALYSSSLLIRRDPSTDRGTRKGGEVCTLAWFLAAYTPDSRTRVGQLPNKG